MNGEARGEGTIVEFGAVESVRVPGVGPGPEGGVAKDAQPPVWLEAAEEEGPCDGNNAHEEHD